MYFYILHYENAVGFFKTQTTLLAITGRKSLIIEQIEHMAFKMCQLDGKYNEGKSLQAQFAEKSLLISMAVQLIFDELELKVDISTTLKRTQY